MVPLNIVSALKKAAEFLGGERRWQAAGAVQEMFLRDFVSQTASLEKFGDKELRAWADTVAARLNAILLANGFTIQLPEFDDGDIGVVSILDVMVEWLKEGTKIQIRPPSGGVYPGVRLDNDAEIDGEDVQLFGGFVSEAHAHPIARIFTKSGDVLSMTIAGEAASGFDLITKINAIRSSTQQQSAFDKLYFPMVDFEETKSLGWLCGLASMPAAGNPHVVADAIQQTKFRMNQFGARLKDAVAIRMGTTSVRRSPPPLMINEPFYLWIERPGVSVPILYAHFDETHWKDPGNLKNM